MNFKACTPLENGETLNAFHPEWPLFELLIRLHLFILINIKILS